MASTRPIYLLNTYTRALEEFKPLASPDVRMYTCGPTVYSYAHIGNFRSFIMADTVRRVLEYNGYRVAHVRNITDVGHLTNDTLATGLDRIEKSALESGSSPWDIAAFYIRAFLADAAQLNLLEPTETPRATEYVADMIDLAQTLVDKGKAYSAGGNVYFDVSSFERYGALSGNDVDDLIAGHRVESGDNKRSPADFALWRATTPDKIMQWDSPWGHGVPGWHLECSAMAFKLLGEEIDIHTGGIDNMFPHHEDEIAQSEAATGKQFVRYWLHSAWLLIDETKMSKSLKNLYTVSDLVERGFHPLSYRYFTAQANYRTPLNFSWEALQGAQAALFRVWEATAEWFQSAEPAPLGQTANVLLAQFHSAVNNDLDLPGALAVLHDVIGARLPAGEKLTLVDTFDRVLGLRSLEMARSLSQISDHERAVLMERAGARKTKNFSRSDQLRVALAQAGLDVKDTPDGQRWLRRDVLPSGRNHAEHRA
ncbi:MAG: cysteine--tRNA ligase [Chloroflexota bacterium]